MFWRKVRTFLPAFLKHDLFIFRLTTKEGSKDKKLLFLFPFHTNFINHQLIGEMTTLSEACIKLKW